MQNVNKVWNGAAAIIISRGKLLMVRGKDRNSWSVPSGGIERSETSEQACIREVWEETGYKVKVIRALHTKKAVIDAFDVTTDYFLCEIIAGDITYHDPDEIIEEIAWKPVDEVENVPHDYPEDKGLLLKLLKNSMHD